MLLEKLKKSLFVNGVVHQKFCKNVLNCTSGAFHDLMYFRNFKYQTANLLFVNAISKWLKDEKRMEKLEESVLTGKFCYLDENDIEGDVINLFKMI
jgi:hypothetical protein